LALFGKEFCCCAALFLATLQLLSQLRWCLFVFGSSASNSRGAVRRPAVFSALPPFRPLARAIPSAWNLLLASTFAA